MKWKHVRIHIIMINKYFNAFFMATNYCFVVSNACDTVVFIKSFEMTIYTSKTEVE